jgi:hypothetical protein
MSPRWYFQLPQLIDGTRGFGGKGGQAFEVLGGLRRVALVARSCA